MKLNSVFKKTIYDWRRALLFFSLGLFLLVMMYSFLFPSISESSELIGALEDFPEALQTLIGDVNLFTTPHGFLAGEFYSITYPVILSILAITMGSGLLSKDEEEGTIELLLSRPVPRASIYSQKLFGMFAVLTLLGIVTILSIWLGSLLVEEFDVSMLRVGGGTFASVVLSWAFGALAYLITAIKSKRGLAAGLVSVYLVFCFLIDTFKESADWVNSIRYSSLFEAFTAQEILLNNSGYTSILILLGVTAVLFMSGIWFFNRRDIA